MSQQGEERQLTHIEKVLKSLSRSNKSVRYFEGKQKYEKNWKSKFWVYLNVGTLLQQLERFYPHSHFLKSYLWQYKQQYFFYAFGVGSMFAAFLFKKLTRAQSIAHIHSVYKGVASLIPMVIIIGLIDFNYVNPVEQLWITHSQLMNKRLTTIPNSYLFGGTVLKRHGFNVQYTGQNNQVV